MSRWPGRRRPPSVPREPPAWYRAFIFEDWTRDGDDEVRYPAGRLVPLVEVARHRWWAAKRRWAAETGFDAVEWLQEMRRARLGPNPVRRRGRR